MSYFINPKLGMRRICKRKSGCEGSGERKFIYLSDAIIRRQHIVAEVYLANGKRFNIIKVERENL